MALTKTGIVVSDKMQKTIVIKTISKIKHPLYKKLMSSSQKFKAQNDMGAKIGDKVKIAETKPISKTVYFKVVEIIGKGN